MIPTTQRFVQEAINAMRHYRVKEIYWICRKFYTPEGSLILKGFWIVDPSKSNLIAMMCSEDLQIAEILDGDYIDSSIISACEAAGLSATLAGVWLLKVEQIGN